MTDNNSTPLDEVLRAIAAEVGQPDMEPVIETPDEKDYTEWTRKQFEALPSRKWNETIYCNSLVILPTKRKHDSGYRAMDVVAIKDGAPLCLVAGGSDVIHIDGIGGYGEWKPGNGIPNTIEPKAWSIDCLPVSGLLQLWPSNHGYIIKVSEALSSLNIYAVKKQK